MYMDEAPGASKRPLVKEFHEAPRGMCSPSVHAKPTLYTAFVNTSVLGICKASSVCANPHGLHKADLVKGLCKAPSV